MIYPTGGQTEAVLTADKHTRDEADRGAVEWPWASALLIALCLMGGLMSLGCSDDAGVSTAAVPTPAPIPGPPPEPESPPVTPEIPGVSFPLRAIHMAGNWGTNQPIIREWENSRLNSLIPEDHIDWLQSLHVNWVGVSVALLYDDYMDSTVERVYEGAEDYGTISDDAIKQIVMELKSSGMKVYLTVSLSPIEGRFSIGRPRTPDGVADEFWPWNPDHPEHDDFVTGFWETYTEHVVHFARIAQEAGVSLFSVGTETDNLFRTRSGGDWPNHFGNELKEMVGRVRAVYSGLLTYDMHYSVLLHEDYYGPGSNNLWNDLELDIIGVSAYFPLVGSPPVMPLSVETLQESYERIFRDSLTPLRIRNPGRPILFLEYGIIDSVQSPFDAHAQQSEAFIFSDMDENGLDDGRETQANVIRALLETMNDNEDVLGGVFFWDNWMASNEEWEEWWAHRRAFNVRDKPAEDVIRAAYEALAEQK